MALNGSDLLACLYDRIGWSVVRGEGERCGSFANDMNFRRGRCYGTMPKLCVHFQLGFDIMIR